MHSRPTQLPIHSSASGRPAAGLAAIWRAVGALLARRGPLCRHQGICLVPGCQFPLGLHLPRLCHRRLQSRPALRPVPDRADRGRSTSSPQTARKPLTALGFSALGGRFMGNVHDVIDDRIDVVCRGLMSLTVTCARCHDHKFDPIPAQDYYSLYGVLASAREPDIPPEAGNRPRTAAYAQFVKELESRQRKLSEFVAAKHREMVEAAKRRAAEYLLAAQKALDQPSTEDFMLLADGNDLNPTMLIRWQVYLATDAQDARHGFRPWHALASYRRRDLLASAARLIGSSRLQ